MKHMPADTTTAPARQTWRFDFVNPATAYAASPAARTINGVHYPATAAERVTWTGADGILWQSQPLVASMAREMATELGHNGYADVQVVPA